MADAVEQPTFRRTALAAAGMLAGVALIGALVAGLLWTANRSAPPATNVEDQRRGILAEVRKSQADLLNDYGPVPGRPGTARIPITAAMDKVLAEGLPAPTTLPATREVNP